MFEITKNSPSMQNAMDAKKAAIEEAKKKALTASPVAVAKITYKTPEECADRIGVIFDDSSSMDWTLENAKTGVVELLRNCIPNSTAVGVVFMNNTNLDIPLNADLIGVAEKLKAASLHTRHTPLFSTLRKALSNKSYTRIVLFTDGEPTDAGVVSWVSEASMIISASESKIPIDCVFFGSEAAERPIQLLKYIAEKTGGFFMRFDPTQKTIWRQLKYLAPVNRLALSDGNFRSKVERGEI